MHNIILYYTIPRSAPATASTDQRPPGPEVMGGLGGGHARSGGPVRQQPPREIPQDRRHNGTGQDRTGDRTWDKAQDKTMKNREMFNKQITVYHYHSIMQKYVFIE